MSLKLGTQDIAGISQNTKYNAHHLLDFKWTDCIMNDVSWLRADSFSWQSGDVYVTAYNHLVQDIQGITAETETIGSYTVTFYRATDGHKVCLADQETTIANIYSETGIAWYYILDTTNTQFKLPRTKYGFEGLRGNVGDYIKAGLPNITGTFHPIVETDTMSGCFNFSQGGRTVSTSGGNLYYGATNFNASDSNSIYGNSTTVQSPATQMYLYFYVGDYSQTAIEQTAGLNSELFNGKVDLPVGRNQSSVGLLVESYVNGTSWYRVYSDGWCEQGLTKSGDNAEWKEFLKPFVDTNYNVQVTATGSSGTSAGDWAYIGAYPLYRETTRVYIRTYCQQNAIAYIYACGYIS